MTALGGEQTALGDRKGFRSLAEIGEARGVFYSEGEGSGRRKVRAFENELFGDLIGRLISDNG